MDGRPTWTDCDEAGDYVVPNVLSPRDLVSRPDIMDETVQHSKDTMFIHLHCHCVAWLITKTSLCKEHPLTPHFYIVKLGFTGVYILSYSCSKT